MALPPRFTSRVAQTSVQRGARRVDPGSAGQALQLIGRAGSQAVQQREGVARQVAESQARIDEAEARRDRQLEVIRQSARLTDIEADTATEIRALQQEPELFAEGHREAVDTLLANRRAEYLEGLPPDEQIRASALAQWDAWAARQEVNADAFQAAQRIEDQGKLWEQSGKQADAMIFANPAPEALTSMLEQAAGVLQEMDLPESDKEQLYNQRGSDGVNALLSGLIEMEQFDQVDALRKSKLLQPFISYQESQKFARLAENGRAFVARQAELEEEKLRDQVRDQAKNAALLIEQGATTLDVPLSSILQQARAVGLDPAEITQIEGMQIALSVNEKYTDINQLESAMRQMEASGSLDQNDQRILAFMRSRYDTLVDDKLGEVEEQYEKGGRARSRSVMQIMASPVSQRVAMARKLDPSGNLQWAVRLPKSTAVFLTNGAEARAADKTLLPTTKGRGDQYRKHFDQMTAGLFDGVSREARVAMYELSLDAIAAHMDNRGADDYDKDFMRQAVNLVLGQRYDPALRRYVGGRGMWNGKPVWLPNNSNQASFDLQMRAYDFEGAAETPQNIRRLYTPYSVRGSVTGHKWYRFVDAGGAELQKADGSGPFEVMFGG